ncbi:Uncharacterised protein [Klebsiella pneumoniae]|nr:Uncharacterised protein [Klebsiella pneumoniae]
MFVRLMTSECIDLQELTKHTFFEIKNNNK